MVYGIYGHINNMNENQLYLNAISAWGKEAQVDMIIEECSELIKVLLEDRRGMVSIENIIDELVDVQIMLYQMNLIFDNKTIYDEIKIKKLNRLKYMLYG